MDIQEFMEDMHRKYGDVLKRMAIKEDDKFRITIYQRQEDFIAVKDNNKEEWVIGMTIGESILLIKEAYPELKDEEGVKYYPLSKYYNEGLTED